MHVEKTRRLLRRITLEMSLKPFTSLEPEAIERVCGEAIRQWLPLIGLSEAASVLLWTADGSEILEWDGDSGRELEWAKYIGFANEWTFSHITKGKDDPKTAIVYRDDPVAMTYADLRTIVGTLKRVATERYGLRLEVGATFDAGPEFAYSDFKYKRHPEINRAELGGSFVALKADYTVVCPWAKLNGDQTRYAAYPEGIPDGTPFGEFLGKQCSSFLPAMGFDYIWFSNGFALSYFPWTYLGANYNGSRLGIADQKELSAKVLSFWDCFKRECPEYRTEIRGTNFGTGMDLAKDGIPLRELYRRGYLEYPPPNSPWGALNYDFGLEMAGYLSRIAVLPGDIYPYRFYPNDPWFWQNPWTDLYDREPHDIYCPLSAARINEQGELEPPRIIELLTIDTERGELPEDTALEVSAHIRRALKDFPDAPGLLTWIYPFDELHEAAAAGSERAGDVFFHDWFARDAINEGLPLNTVISSEAFRRLTSADEDALRGTIAVSSTGWLEGDEARRIARFVQRGGKALLYGPVRDATLRKLLNLNAAPPLSGECELVVELPGDRVKGAAKEFPTLLHREDISSGGLGETCAEPPDPFTNVRAIARQGGESRAFALSRARPEWNGGIVAWIRGSLPYRDAGVTHLPVRQEGGYADTAALARSLLRDFGYAIRQEKRAAESPSALLFVSRKDNGFVLAGCKQDTSVKLSLRFPDGVPVPIGQTTEAGPGEAEYAANRTFRDECRVFVDQAEPSLVGCRELSAVPTDIKRFLHNLTTRKLTVSNLRNARIAIYPPLQALADGRVEVKLGERSLALAGARQGDKLVLGGLTGTIEITW
ncbi:C45 family peptidase [Cohnella fermenti]|uniref:Beta-galactosidase trimerisation domain-containing protein n=1 Tax=Cohnella fermenti TaxID=2565925 RepID=A0A4S4BUR0_9BACL|nr:hypothetical protein [Cohnella fermenti]THF76674.1 hypothetical protein E6C55_18030 [Cohnella fermenti]